MIYVSFDIGVKNLALCVLKHTDHAVTILDWRVICLAEKKSHLKGANAVADVLYCELDEIVAKWEQIDKVIIENQPSNLNGIMKTIQYLIFAYFDLLRHWDGIVGEVILISPVHKLQNHNYVVGSVGPIGPVGPAKDTTQTNRAARKTKYNQNKAHSIEICRHYIRNDEALQAFFASHKKKDDLADTCLQAISYIRKNGATDIEDITLDALHIIKND